MSFFGKANINKDQLNTTLTDLINSYTQQILENIHITLVLLFISTEGPIAVLLPCLQALFVTHNNITSET